MKKKLPLVLHKSIEPLLPIIDKKIFKIDKSNNILLKIVDVDSESDFFFEITAFEFANGYEIFRYKMKPYNKSKLDTRSASAKLDEFPGIIESWINVMIEYSNINTIYDDPILKQYEEDFNSTFVSADSDAERVSFKLDQQLLLDQALNNIVGLLKEKINEENKAELSAIIVEVQEVQDEITTCTKNEIFGKMSKIFAKIQKGGLKWIKDVYPVIQKEIIGQIIKSVIHLPEITIV